MTTVEYRRKFASGDNYPEKATICIKVTESGLIQLESHIIKQRNGFCQNNLCRSSFLIIELFVQQRNVDFAAMMNLFIHFLFSIFFLSDLNR